MRDRGGDSGRARSGSGLVGSCSARQAPHAGRGQAISRAEFCGSLAATSDRAAHRRVRTRQSAAQQLREEERHSVGFIESQRKRKLVEQSFAWIKHWAGFRQVKLRSRKRVEWLFQIAAAAYNLVRMTRLLAPAI